MKKNISRIFSLIMALVLLVSLAVPAFAADSTTAVIDETKTGSMTIYKIDFTNAEKDGVWDHSYVSTGVADEDVYEKLISDAVRDGDVDNATVFTPTDTGKLIIKGLENDTYRLTETNTDNGYILLTDYITMEISVAEKDVCGIYETDALGLVQNDPRFQGVDEGLYHNMPQVALSHKTLTASAVVDGNTVTMLPDDASAQAFAPLTVVNTRGFELPQTGEFGAIMLPTIGISGIVLACFVILQVMPRRKEEN